MSHNSYESSRPCVPIPPPSSHNKAFKSRAMLLSKYVEELEIRGNFDSKPNQTFQCQLIVFTPTLYILDM